MIRNFDDKRPLGKNNENIADYLKRIISIFEVLRNILNLKLLSKRQSPKMVPSLNRKYHFY